MAEPGVCRAAPFTFPVTLLGAGAERALASGLDGRVMAVFRRSFYVESKSGGLACLGPPSLGGGPLNAIAALPDGIDWQASGLVAGARARRGGEALVVDGRFAFPLAGAPAWRPGPPAMSWTAADLGRGLDTLATRARLVAPADCLGPLIPGLAGREGAAGEGDFAASPFLCAASAGVAALRAWLESVLGDDRWGEGEDAQRLRGAAGLIGLGPGLTPSGDDFVGGAMIALRTFDQSGAADRLAAWALPLARAQTGAISYAHLACAAQGEGAAALHEALAALGTPGAPGLAAHLDAIDAIGHTSGWDALAGAVAAVAALGCQQSFQEN
ncbi:MAG: DUF2877 domain-containing protein [Rhodospirillales bacterium]|nr:DUF2877 domain-containing protein [Rhodospirillales bacterium]